MIRSLYRCADGQIRTNLTAEELLAARSDAQGLLWVDFNCAPADACEPILRDVFGFHPLAIDDALKETHVARVDDWEQYLYLVLHTVELEEKYPLELRSLELDVFLGTNYLVTHHERTMGAVDDIWHRWQSNERGLRSGPGRLLYELADQLVAAYLPVIDRMDDLVDHIEQQMFDHPQPQILEDLFRLRRAVVDMRRTIAPEREVLNRLARDDFAVIDRRLRIYFRDVYDHLVRLHETCESLRDLAGGALEVYLSVVNNRLNDVMKTLTIITTLFMPISFLSGFFGMNFFQPAQPLVAWTGMPALVATLAVMVLLPLGMFMWVRRRGWM